MAVQYTSHKFMENQVRFVTEPSRVTAKYEGFPGELPSGKLCS